MDKFGVLRPLHIKVETLVIQKECYVSLNVCATLFCRPVLGPCGKRPIRKPPAAIIFEETDLLQYVQVTFIWLCIFRFILTV